MIDRIPFQHLCHTVLRFPYGVAAHFQRYTQNGIKVLEPNIIEEAGFKLTRRKTTY